MNIAGYLALLFIRDMSLLFILSSINVLASCTLSIHGMALNVIHICMVLFSLSFKFAEDKSMMCLFSSVNLDTLIWLVKGTVPGKFISFHFLTIDVKLCLRGISHTFYFKLSRARFKWSLTRHGNYFF